MKAADGLIQYKTVGIPEQKLPDIVKPGVIAGHLTRKAAQLTGLREGIPVAVGTNDAAAAQAGAGNTKAGDMLIVSGSSEMISILTDKAVVNDKYYLRRAAADGLWQIFAITASGLVIDWFRREFYKEMDETTFYREALPAAIRQYYSTKVRFAPYIAGIAKALCRGRGFRSYPLTAPGRSFGINSCWNSQTDNNCYRNFRLFS